MEARVLGWVFFFSSPFTTIVTCKEARDIRATWEIK